MQDRTSQKGIINLVVMFTIGIFALGTALSMSDGILLELLKNKNQTRGSQAFYTAEANSKEGAYQIAKEFAATSTTTYDGGTSLALNSVSSADITVTDLGWPYKKINGLASRVNSARAVVQMLTVYPEGLAFNHAVYAQDDLTLKGNVEIYGSVFSNGTMNFNGGPDIYGDAYSTEPIDNNGGNISGDIFTSVDPIPPPQVDLTPYYDEALAGGTLFASATSTGAFLSNQTRTAIVYANTTQKTTIQNTNLTGSLVTTGDLDLTGGGTYTASADRLAIIVQGNLKIAGGVTIHGIVYVTGQTSFGGGNNTIDGSLISAGGTQIDTTVAGNATITYNPAIAASWQELQGIAGTTSTEDPRIIEWREE